MLLTILTNQIRKEMIKMELKYTKTGDYELPNLTLNDNKKGANYLKKKLKNRRKLKSRLKIQKKKMKRKINPPATIRKTLKFWI